MFGRRSDGRRVVQEDPIVGLVPYIMPQRVDAQVHTLLHVNCDTLTKYIRSQRDSGYAFSYMDLITAGYVRAVSQYPYLNRFISNKQVFARNSICVSLTIVKAKDGVDDALETTIKVHFSPYDTIYDVHNKFKAEIDKNRKPEEMNSTDKIARVLLSIPGLPTTVVMLARLLDRYGLMPRFLVNASPFHTGLFIANMASIGLPHVNHHIYNFGTTSLFIGIGSTVKTAVPGPNGSTLFERSIPLGIVADERIISGADLGRALGLWRAMLNDPEKLEVPPENAVYEIPPEKMPSLLSRKERRREKKKAAMGA